MSRSRGRRKKGEFRVGDVVRFKNSLSKEFSAPKGLLGTVRVIEPQNHYNQHIGVQFLFFNNGHNLLTKKGKTCEGGGWWCEPEELILLRRCGSVEH